MCYLYFHQSVFGQGTVVVAGRARAIVVGVGANTAMGSIRDFMLQTEDVKPLLFTAQLFYLNTNPYC